MMVDFLQKLFHKILALLPISSLLRLFNVGNKWKSLEAQISTSENPGAMMVDGPDELLYEIMVFLPMSSLIRSRIVCKRWNSLVKDVQFQKAWANVHGGEHFVFYREFIEHVLKLLQIKDSNPIYTHMSVVDGLLLLKNDHDEFHIVDPVNAYLRKIPHSELSSAEQTLGMVVYPGRKNYSIFMVSRPGCCGHDYEFLCHNYSCRGYGEPVIVVHRYDSLQDSWHVACNILPHPRSWELFLEGDVVVHRGYYHFLMLGSYDKHNCQVRITRYDAGHHRWEDSTEGLPTLLCNCNQRPLFFELNAKLFLSGFDRDIYCVWQYNDNAAKWNLLDKFPKNILDVRIRRLRPYCFYIQRHENFLYLRKWDPWPPTLPTPIVITYNLLDRQYRTMRHDEVQRELVPLYSIDGTALEQWFILPSH